MDKIHTPDEVAKHLGVPVRTLTDWRYKGKGPAYFRAGKFVRYRESAVNKWQKEEEAPQAAERESA
jgi:excisionase family DNA binding protein